MRAPPIKRVRPPSIEPGSISGAAGGGFPPLPFPSFGPLCCASTGAATAVRIARTPRVVRACCKVTLVRVWRVLIAPSSFVAEIGRDGRFDTSHPLVSTQILPIPSIQSLYDVVTALYQPVDTGIRVHCAMLKKIIIRRSVKSSARHVSTSHW
jgi:hypothetical protein